MLCNRCHSGRSNRNFSMFNPKSCTASQWTSGVNKTLLIRTSRFWISLSTSNAMMHFSVIHFCNVLECLWLRNILSALLLSLVRSNCTDLIAIRKSLYLTSDKSDVHEEYKWRRQVHYTTITGNCNTSFDGYSWCGVVWWQKLYLKVHK